MRHSFSVVVPLYNQAELIRESLAPLMQPAARGLEVIVVDDGSTDGSGAVVEALATASDGASIRLIRQENAGAGAARNRGVAEAGGDWVAFLDSDDIWMPWAIGTIEAALAAAGTATLLFWRTQFFRDPATLPSGPDGAPEVVAADSYLDFYIRQLLPVYGSCNAAVRRSHFLRIGGFDPAIRSAEDQDLFMRLSGLGGALAVVSPVLMGNRIGMSGKLSRNYAAVADGLIQILSKRQAGAYAGSDALLDRQLANMAKVAFWRMLDGGDRVSASRLLKAFGGTVRRVLGLRYLLAMRIALVRPRVPTPLPV